MGEVVHNSIWPGRAYEKRRNCTKSKKQPPAIWYRFDGPIVHENHLSLRATARTADHLQSAIDRAYLDTRYGDVFKYQKLKHNEYELVDFIALTPEPGSFIQTIIAKASNPTTRNIIDKINSTLSNAYDRLDEPLDQSAPSIREQANQRKELFRISKEAPTYEEFVNTELDSLSTAYADRSINKELDQILGLIRQEHNEGSTFEISLYGSKPGGKFDFDTQKSKAFHKIVSERRIGTPMILDIELRSLDAGKNGTISSGKAKNLSSGKECNMLIADPLVFGRLAPHLRRTRRKRIQIAACPIYEYDAWDPNGGDIMVVAFLGATANDQ